MARNCQDLSPTSNEWVKGKLVGSGSFGTVHLALSKNTGGLFVVKSAQSRSGIEALENEAEILKSLDSSPYVVQCLGTEKSENDLNVLMEYMPGGSLADVATKFGGSLEEEVVRLYTREILLGLKYLHQQGIVHCDLKCKNVLLDLTGKIKLADFGCAKRLKDMKSGGSESDCLVNCWQSVGGTPLWMAPEVLRNEKLDFKADLWSLGCTVIEMATGRPPWGDEVSNPMAVVLKIAFGNDKPQLPSHMSKEGLDFLTRCLERDPKLRWTTEELLSHPFVSRNSSRPCEEECVGSPASVLEVQSFEDEYDSDEEESAQENDSIPWCYAERREAALLQQEDSDLLSSGNWITVRSG